MPPTIAGLIRYHKRPFLFLFLVLIYFDNTMNDGCVNFGHCILFWGFSENLVVLLSSIL